MWSIHTMRYYLAKKRNEVLIQASTRMSLENVMLSESGQTHTQQHISDDPIDMRLPEPARP